MKSLRILIFGIALVTALAHAHDVPVQLPSPASDAEAWNVIEQSTANIDQLLAGHLEGDVGAQLANIAPALRYLGDHASPPSGDAVRTSCPELIADELPLLKLCRDGNADAVLSAWRHWRGKLGEVESHFPATTVQATIFICPMHPLDRHLDAAERCTICGMSLVRRHLPASATYQKPGEPTMKLSVEALPLVVGTPADVTLHLATADGRPVELSQLLESHTKKIHLLINDAGLDDYHHEHPEPTDHPGEYRFRFTPKHSGPYRIWADVIPVDSGIQEYVIADLPVAAGAVVTPIVDRQTRLTSSVDGKIFQLAIDSGNKPPRSGNTYVGTLNVTDGDGKPFTQLEPVMGSFAHLVGFCEDGKTVLHIHPWSREPNSPEDRAGPAFAFKFYSPVSGFIRFYCQVRIGGRDVFAPFNVNVTP